MVGSANAFDVWFQGWGGIELDWNTLASWWHEGDPVDGIGLPTAADTPYIDALGAVAGIDAAGAALTLKVGAWLDIAGPSILNVKSGANLAIGSDLILGVEPYEDWGTPAWGNHGWGKVNVSGGNVVVGNELAVGVLGLGELYLTGGTIQADVFSMGTPSSSAGASIVYTFPQDNIVKIAGGKLILLGNISSLDSRVVGPDNMSGSLVFTYEADLTGYTTITPEPATICLLGLGGLLLRRRRRA